MSVLQDRAFNGMAQDVQSPFYETRDTTKKEAEGLLGLLKGLGIGDTELFYRGDRYPERILVKVSSERQHKLTQALQARIKALKACVLPDGQTLELHYRNIRIHFLSQIS